MKLKSFISASVATSMIVASTAGSAAFAAPVKPAAFKSVEVSKGNRIEMARGRSQQVMLPSAITDIVVSDPQVADIEVKSPRQIWIFAKQLGDTTISATDASGRIVYTAQIRVVPRMNSIDEMFEMAMPDAKINVMTMPGGILLTGSVVNPADIAEAEKLAAAFLDSGTRIISRLKTATPYQVNLQVRIAEVSRSLAKEISSNFEAQDIDGPGGNGTLFVPNRGRDVADITNQFVTDPVTGVVTRSTNVAFKQPSGTNTLSFFKSLFGLDMALGLDMAERAGLATTLANPNLTTMSGESAEFLAGGSFPIPVADSFGSVSVTQQTYGISLSYTPTVLADGRIRLQVNPEVSDITSNGAVRVGGVEIPALLTRRVQTTVELGSGQSFMIAGLLSNSANSSVDKFPGLGDVPVLGALFKSTGWRRNQTELVIIVTPYLVKPVSEDEIKLPTDGFNAPNDLERFLLHKQSTTRGGSERPKATVAPDAPQGPDMGAVSQAAPPITNKAKETKAAAASGPGFSFD